MATDVTTYENYRGYMRDRFAELQTRKPAFSQRLLARNAGIANPGFFNEVIQGRRRLSTAAAAKIAVGLELSPWEAGYFSAFVEFTEAREGLAKAKAGDRMTALKKQRQAEVVKATVSPAARLGEIIRELERDWVLQAADLCADQSPPQAFPSLAEPMEESDFIRISEQLARLRARAETEPNPRAIHFCLRMAPRLSDPQP